MFETTQRQLVAEELGVAIEQVAIRQGDTDEVPDAVGTFASRGAAIGGAVGRMAARELIKNILNCFASLLNCDPCTVKWEKGGVTILGSTEDYIPLSEIPARLAAHAQRTLEHIRWTPAQVREFTGCFLSEPKAQVFFTPPRRPLSRARFEKRSARSGLALDPRSRLLFSGTMFYINGETIAVPARARPGLRRLADARTLAGPLQASAEFWDVVYAWYLLGFVQGEAT